MEAQEARRKRKRKTKAKDKEDNEEKRRWSKNTEASGPASGSHKEQSNQNLDTRDQSYNQPWVHVVKHDERQSCHKKYPPKKYKKKQRLESRCKGGQRETRKEGAIRLTLL